MSQFWGFRMKMKLSVYAGVAFAALMTSTANAAVATYSFTKIADTTGEISGFGAPSINNSGEVAVRAGIQPSATTSAADSVIIGNGGAPNEVFRCSACILGNPSINDSGDTAFKFESGGSQALLFVRNDGFTRPLTDTASGPYFSFGPFGGGSAIDLDNSGTLAFAAVRDDSVQEIGAASLSGVSTIVDNTGPLSNISLGSTISSNNAGEVAFVAGFDFPDANGNSGGVLVSDGTTTGVIVGNASSGLDGLRSPSINDNGQVAFVADDFDPATAALRGVYLFDNGALSTIADDTGVFNVFGDAAINNNGDVAFLSFMDDGRQSVNVFSNGVIQTILASGDMLDGLLVLSIFVFQGGPTQFLNDAGQVAFVAQLEGGVNAVYRASINGLVSEVPLPAAAWAFLAGIGGLAAAGRKRVEGKAVA